MGKNVKVKSHLRMGVSGRPYKVELSLPSGKSAGFIGAKGTRCSTYTKQGALKIKEEMSLRARKGYHYGVIYDPKGEKARAYKKSKKKRRQH